MSLLDRFMNRAPVLPNQSGMAFGTSIFGGNARTITPDNAMQLTTVFACNRVLAETISSISLNLFRRVDSGKEPATDHSLYKILKHMPNRYMNSVTWREHIVTDLNFRGNHYSQIIRNGLGEVVALYPLIASRMDVTFSKMGNKQYFYKTSSTQSIELSAFEILHIVGLPSDDGLTGMSPITANKRALELGSTAESYGSKFFDNGSTATGAFTHPGELSEPAYNRLKGDLQTKYDGLKNAHKPILLEEGMSFEKFTISNSDSQFLETRKYQKEEIASIFRVPMHMINSLENATFSNIEHQSLEFVQFTILPWLKRIEQSLTMSLLTEDEYRDYAIKFNVDTLLRGDFETRTAGYASLFNIGAISQNEIRAKENMNSIGTDGDKYYVQLNMGDPKTQGENT